MVTPVRDAPLSWTSGTVAVAGGHLAFHRTGGAKPALVLSHGLTDNGLCWARVAQALADDFDVVMLDARGHGSSTRLAAGEAHDAGNDIADAIRGLELRSPVVMGHSVGARATADYAAANPGQAAKVILEDPPLLPILAPDESLRRRAAFRAQVEHVQSLSDPEILAMGRQSSPGWHEDEFSAWVLGKRQVDPCVMPHYAMPWQDVLARISVPTLLIHGEPERGSLVSPAIAAEAMALNPLVRTVQISGAGHNIRRENPSGLLAVVRAFLREDDSHGHQG